MKMVEVFPFTKLSWKTPAIQRQWEPLRRRIYDAVHYTEYEMVKRGYRKCDVYDFTPSNIMPRLKRVAKDGLTFIPILISKTYGGYGHRHYVTDKFIDGTFIYGGIARNPEDAVRFHDAGVTDLSQRMRKWREDEMNPRGIDHEVTGELLGYPKCDRDFFTGTWLKGGCLDPMYEMAENTENVEYVKRNHVKVMGSPLLNRLCRYWGYNIVPHFPHSFDCAPSKVFADKWYGLMREHDEEAAEACLAVLSMPMVWSMSNCIIEVQHPLFWGSANGYYREGKITVEWYPE